MGFVPGGGVSKQRLGLVGVAGDVQAPARQRREAGDVPGGVMRVAAGGPVVARPHGDEDRTDALMPKIELHLLEGALDEKWSVGMDDRPEAFQGMTRGDADQELLPDADVAQPPGMSLRSTGCREPIGSDVREQQHDARVRVEQFGSRRR